MNFIKNILVLSIFLSPFCIMANAGTGESKCNNENDASKKLSCEAEEECKKKLAAEKRLAAKNGQDPTSTVDDSSSKANEVNEE